MPQTSLWDSHTQVIQDKLQTEMANDLDLLLECSNWVSFHNGLCWLCLHLLLLAKHHPHTSFRCWLDSGLNAAKAWEGEDASLFHFLRSDGCKTVEDRSHRCEGSEKDRHLHPP